jgi:hypothetical protein
MNTSLPLYQFIKDNQRAENPHLSRLFCTLLLAGLIVFPGFSEITAETQKKIQRSVIKEKSDVPRITPKELMDRLYSGKSIMIVDVRTVEEYRAKHIISALSMPLDQIESRIDEFKFPLDRDIVFY